MRVDASQILAQGGVKTKQGTETSIDTIKDKGTSALLKSLDDTGLTGNEEVEEGSEEEDLTPAKQDVTRGFADKSLEPYAAKLAALNMPVTEESARLMREVLTQHPKLSMDEAAFLASNKIVGNEDLMRAALEVLKGGDKTHEMISKIITTLEEKLPSDNKALAEPRTPAEPSVSQEAAPRFEARNLSNVHRVPMSESNMQAVQVRSSESAPLTEIIAAVVKSAHSMLPDSGRTDNYTAQNTQPIIPHSDSNMQSNTQKITENIENSEKPPEIQQTYTKQDNAQSIANTEGRSNAESAGQSIGAEKNAEVDRQPQQSQPQQLPEMSQNEKSAAQQSPNVTEVPQQQPAPEAQQQQQTPQVPTADSPLVQTPNMPNITITQSPQVPQTPNVTPGFQIPPDLTAPQPEVPAPQTPTMPVADLPQTPTMPVTDLPQTPTMPVADLPQMPTMPVADLPQMPTMPVADLPQTPTMPVADLPQTPTMPVADLPQTPTMPVTDLPQTPQAPLIPVMPGSVMPNIVENSPVQVQQGGQTPIMPLPGTVGLIFQSTAAAGISEGIHGTQIPPESAAQQEAVQNTQNIQQPATLQSITQSQQVPATADNTAQQQPVAQQPTIQPQQVPATADNTAQQQPVATVAAEEQVQVKAQEQQAQVDNRSGQVQQQPAAKVPELQQNTQDAAKTPVSAESAAVSRAVAELLSEIPQFQGTPASALDRFSNMLLRIAADTGIIEDKAADASNVDKLAEQLEKMFTKIGRKDADAGARLREAREELFARLTLVQEEISKASGPVKNELLSQTQKLMDHVRVLNNIDQFVYMQLPVKFSEEEKTAELYVFKRKGGKRVDPENVNILLSIDLEFMGHWEALLNIRGNKDVYLNMQVEGEAQKVHFNANTVLLHELLAEDGFKLVNTSIKISKEETTPLTALSTLESYKGSGSGRIDLKW